MKDDSHKQVDQVLDKLNKAIESYSEIGQGRNFDVGTKVLYKGQFGVVTDLNKDAVDPTGSTVDIRLHNGKVVEQVSVTSQTLQFFRS